MVVNINIMLLRLFIQLPISFAVPSPLMSDVKLNPSSNFTF